MYNYDINRLDYRIAGFLRRAFAFVTDLLIIQILYTMLLFIGYFAVRFGVEDINGSPSFELILRLAIPFFLIYFPLFIIYFTTFCFVGGQTPGKMIFGIKVVSGDGGGINLGFSLVRSLGYFASSFFFGLGFLIALLNRRRRALHDLLSGSYVVRARPPSPFISYKKGVGNTGFETNLPVFLLLSLLILFPVNFSSGEIVDQVIAVVNNEVISLSDLKNYMALYSVSRQNTDFDETRRVALQELIDERLILAEASRFGIEEPTEEEIKEEIRRLEEGIKGPDGVRERLSWHGLEPDELHSLLRNRLIIKRFIDQRINLFILISPEEVDSYLKKNKKEFEGLSQEEAKIKLIKMLTDERSKEKTGELKAKLRAKADIRINSEG